MSLHFEMPLIYYFTFPAGVNQIRNTVLNGNRKYKTFDRLAQLSDRFPRRLAGSQILEDSIGQKVQGPTRRPTRRLTYMYLSLLQIFCLLPKLISKSDISIYKLRITQSDIPIISLLQFSVSSLCLSVYLPLCLNVSVSVCLSVSLWSLRLLDSNLPLSISR